LLNRAILSVPLTAGYQSSYGTPQGKQASDAYNAVIQVATIKFAMLDMMKKPPSWAKVSEREEAL
jgi:hypothetical protein